MAMGGLPPCIKHIKLNLNTLKCFPAIAVLSVGVESILLVIGEKVLSTLAPFNQQSYSLPPFTQGLLSSPLPSLNPLLAKPGGGSIYTASPLAPNEQEVGWS